MRSCCLARLPAMVLMFLACPIACPIACANAGAQDGPLKLVAQASETYQSALNEEDRDRRVQQFRTAETLFSQAITLQQERQPTHSVSPDLFVNQGNAALGCDRLGPAILAYRRALVMNPNHPRATQNIEHARSLLPDWVPVPEQETITMGSFFDSLNNLSQSSRWEGAALVFFVAAVFLALHLKSENRVWRLLSVLAGILWLVLLGWSWMAGSGDDQSIAVVIVPEVKARSADSNNAPARFSEPLPSGTELIISESRDEWDHVNFFDGREAWLPSWATERVSIDER